MPAFTNLAVHRCAARLAHRVVRTFMSAAIAVSAVLGAAEPAAGQACKDWIGGPMTGFSYGTDGLVRTMIAWDHDGVPDTPSLLVVAGDFQHAGGVAATNIAAWDGATWQAMGAGLDDAGGTASVYGLAVYNGGLYAVGNFTSSGGVIAHSIARWNGSSWQGMNNGFVVPLYAATVYNGKLIVAGIPDENDTPGNPEDNLPVFQWDGSNWSFLDFGLNGPIYSLAVLNGELYAGGMFTRIGGINAYRIAKWNGSSWQALPGLGIGGVNTIVRTLVYNPYSNWLFVAGTFDLAGGITAHNAVIFNGVAWIPMASGIGAGQTAAVYAATVTPDPGRRIVAVASENAADVVRAWDGTAWQTLTDGLTAGGRSALLYDPVTTIPGDEMLLVGGDFTHIGTPGGPVPVNRIAQITDTGDILALFSAGPVRAMAADNIGYVAGGDFVIPAAGSTGVAHYLARWDGTTLRTVEPFPNDTVVDGTNGPVHALCTQSVGLFFHNLYIGGDFTAAGGVLANRIVKFTSSSETVLKSFSPMGAGFDNRVMAIAIHNNEVYAAGMFTHTGGTPINHIAKWNQAALAWQPVGQGLSGFVYALKSFNGELYATGTFNFGGDGASLPGIARWNGSTWNTVNSLGINGGGFALAVQNGTLVVGGGFTGAGGIPAPGVARWNGSSWSAIGAGLPGIVNSLAVSPDGVLTAGGRFTNTFLTNLAEWNGSTWISTQFNNSNMGPFDRVYAMMHRGGELQAGGQFQHVNGYSTPCWGRLRDWSAPLFIQTPYIPGPQCPGVNVQMSVALDPEYASGYSYRWRKNGIDLANGPGFGGSVISGADTPVLSITSINGSSIGSYACAVTKFACAPGLSPATSLTLSTTCTCLADSNGDGLVNIDDLLGVINAWGPCGDPNNCPADIAPPGGNNVVDIDDLLAVISAWGVCPPPVGACCLGAACAQMTATACGNAGGVFQGNYLPCEAVSCFFSDECDSAAPMFPGPTFVNTTFATDNPNIPDPCGDIGTDVWFMYQAVSGFTTFSTCGATQDTVIAVYQDCSDVASGFALGCNDNFCGQQARLSVPTFPGQMLWVRVGHASNGPGGQFTLLVTP